MSGVSKLEGAADAAAPMDFGVSAPHQTPSDGVFTSAPERSDEPGADG